MLYLSEPTHWTELQLLTKQLFDELSCKSEVEKNIVTVRGKVCVDVYIKDFVSSPPLVYLCECKYWRKKVSKAVVHSFRTVVHDSGANRGYIISKAGFQSGAFEAAMSSNVELVTWEQLQVLFKDRWISALKHKIISTADQISDLTKGFKKPKCMTKDEMDEYSFLVFHLAALTVASCFDEMREFPWEFTDYRTDDLENKRLISVNSWREYFDYMIPFCDVLLKEFHRFTEPSA